MLRVISIFLLFLLAEGSPSIELELSFKTTLDEYEMGYSSVSFTISEDIIYVVNGANVGNAILKFDLAGHYLEEYPGWFNFPHDILIGGESQALVSALGAMGDDGKMRFGFVVYDSQGNFLHGLHQNQSGLRRPFGMTKMSEGGDWFLAADWEGNMTYLMDIDWTDGTVKDRQELIGVPWPSSLDMSTQQIVVASLVCCQLEEFIKMTIYDLSGNLMQELTHLPTGEKIVDPRDVALDPLGNILLSDSVLGTVVLSTDGTSLLSKLPLDPPPHKIIFYQEKLYTLHSEETGEDRMDSFINVYKYSF